MNSSFSIAFYNVENLFDIRNNLKKDDDDFLPKSPKNWNQNRYELKIQKISKVLREIGFEHTSDAPVMIGLCEIENDKVLTDLVQHQNLKDLNYQFIHFNSQDERGIDVALLYRRDFFEIIEAKNISVDLQDSVGNKDFSRDILYCKGKLYGKLVHSITVHLPSKRENDVNLPNRIKVLKEIRGLIDEIQVNDSQAYMILNGDFNEDPNSKYFKEYLNFNEVKFLDEVQIFNPFSLLLTEKKYSLFHKGQGFLFDQMMFSNEFLVKNTAFNYQFSDVFSPSYLQEFSHKMLGQPFRTFEGTRYVGGYSDHFPVYTVIEKTF